MPQNLTIAPTKSDGDEALFASLGLGEAERSALAKQGFVRPETSKSGRSVYKLRFRLLRQRVVYLGSDEARAQRIREALDRWQQARRMALAFGKLRLEVRRRVRASQRRLEPLVKEAGFRVHGWSIRKQRRRAQR